MIIIGTLLAIASMIAFVVAAVAVFQPMPKLGMGTPKAAAIGMLLSVGSCAAGSMLIQTDKSLSAAASRPSVEAATGVPQAAAAHPEAVQPSKAGPLQDSVAADPQPLAPDADHPPADAVRHIEQTLDLWDALDRCRRDPTFKFYGLGAGGPCGNFAEVAENLRESAMEKVVYQLGLQCSAGDVSTAAVSYVDLASRRDPEQVKYLAWVRGHMDECRRKLPSLEPRIEVSRSGMGEAWPLTVGSGTVGCDNRHRIWFQPSGSSVRYAVNGTAKGKFKDIKPIWARDPQYADDSDGIVMRKMMTPLIQAGENVC